MFADAGYREANGLSGSSDRMIDEIIIRGDEKTAAGRLAGAFECGATELLVSILVRGRETEKSWRRTATLIADLCEG